MAIKNLPKYKDMRGKLASKGTYKSVSLSSKTWLVIHHSATAQSAGGSNAEAYARYHVNSLGWPGVGYHFTIEIDGTIKQNHDLNKVSYHVGNSNSRSIGIVLSGNFVKGKEKPTQEQMNSLYLLVKEVRKEVPSISRVLGHQECPGYAWKNCPGDNWSYQEVIKGVGVTVGTSAPTQPSTPVSNAEFHVIASGDTLWGISRKYGIALIDLKALNPYLVEKSLKIGDKIRLKKEGLKAGEHTGLSDCECSACKQKAKPNPTPTEKYPLPNRTLKQGDKGEEVRQLQRGLNAVYFKVGNVDGIYGAKTKDAVKRFQSVYCNPADGIFGPKTREALRKQLANK